MAAGLAGPVPKALQNISIMDCHTCIWTYLGQDTYRAMLFDGFGSYNDVVSIRQRQVSEELRHLLHLRLLKQKLCTEMKQQVNLTKHGVGFMCSTLDWNALRKHTSSRNNVMSF